MSLINIDIQELKLLESHMNNIADDVRENASTMVFVGNDMETAWKSAQSSGIYIEEIRMVADSLKELALEAEGIAKVIKNYVEGLEEAERENAQLFSRVY